MPSYLDKAKKLIRIEAAAIADLEKRIDVDFEKSVELLFNLKGKVVITGVGKSGLIGRKIAATLSGTGTPSFFVHAYEAGHGDLGGVSKDDGVIVISNSGETEDVLYLLPALKKLGVPIVGLVGKPDSSLARKCDILISTAIENEACPLGVVPTTSAIVTLALGDALAIALMDKRNFRTDDFAGLHPGGSLGRRLLTTVKDLMHTGKALPFADVNDTMKSVLFVMTQKGFGVVGILNDRQELIGVITDGDLRRGLERTDHFLTQKAGEVMTINPKWVTTDSLAIDALYRMEEHAVTVLFVYRDQAAGKPTGLIHIHDILRYGIMT